MEEKKYIEGLKKRLLAVTPIKITYTDIFFQAFSEQASVYFFSEGDNIIYIGETINIHKRMANLKTSKKHIFLRHLGYAKLKELLKGKRVTSKRGLPDEIEKKVKTYIMDNIFISHLPVSLGRKELEEYMINKFSDTGKLLNKSKYTVVSHK